MQQQTWTITINEVWNHRGGGTIFNSFQVQAAPDTKIAAFMELVKSAPGNNDPGTTTANNLMPFDPAWIGSRERQTGNIQPENPDRAPNCKWEPSPHHSKTIQDAG